MAASLERNEGNGLALFINGDLQFDSSDEKIYHEALALPALALVAKRVTTPLRVLVIGGGDGLVARELFKSNRVERLDLVDYDPEIIGFAQDSIVTLNNASLADPRMEIHVEDAWEFVDRALAASLSYDLIVSDLTVPESAHEARFHSVTWYAKLAGLLSNQGILAVNGVSPQATPQAFWSIFNSMIKGNLHARPYHINLPSFKARGYGEDWGFLLGSKQPISKEEMDTDLSVAAPREFLQESSDLLRLFIFPEELFAFQPSALPALVGSDILIHYFINATPLTGTTGGVRYTFALDSEDIFVPEPDAGTHILPPELCQALSRSIDADGQFENNQPDGVPSFLQDILSAMPSLQREQTSALIADFLQAPARFLQGIDLQALVARLLRRAAELPAHLVAELNLLQAKLQDWADDQENLLSLGHRVLSILILAIVVGNLLFPDSVYAKGSHSGVASHSSHSSSHNNSGGHRGVNSYGGGWGGGGWNGGYNNNNNRVIGPGQKKGPMGPGPNDAAVKRMQKEGALPVDNHLAIEDTSGGEAQAQMPAELVAYFEKVIRENKATANALNADRDELASNAAMLKAELENYRASDEPFVTYGTRSLPKEEAVALMEAALHKTEVNIQALDQRISELPASTLKAELGLKLLAEERGA